MKHQIRLMVFGGLLAVAESTALTWRGPMATLAAMDAFFGAQESPLPTPAPAAAPLLRKRQTNREQTCGFLSGALDDPIACPSGASCVVNTVSSLVGCCASGDCHVPLTCLPLESSADGTRADPSQTLYCSESAAPACATLVYLDPSHLGVSGYFCDAAPTEYAVYYSAFAGGSTPPAATTTMGNAKGTKATSAAGAPSGTSAADGKDSGGGSSSPPIGAIVGGVVGGVAVLALLAFALFFILRRSRKPRYVATPQAPLPNDPFNHPSSASYMSQTQPHYLASGAYGAAKPSYDGSAVTTASNVPSPSPTPTPGMMGMRGVHHPPPPEGYDASVPYGPDYVGVAPYSDTPAAAELPLQQERDVAELGATGRERPISELPVERAHGDLRELA